MTAYRERFGTQKALVSNSYRHNVELLKSQKAAGMRVAVATSSFTDEARRVLTALELLDLLRGFGLLRRNAQLARAHARPLVTVPAVEPKPTPSRSGVRIRGWSVAPLPGSSRGRRRPRSRYRSRVP